MCCFSRPVTIVKNTRIFARMTRPGRQVLVYQMEYAATESLSMILPIPIRLPARPEAVRFLSLKEYPKFFERMRNGFPTIQLADIARKGIPTASSKPFVTASAQRTGTNSGKATAGLGGAASILPVVRVGDYEATFVPTLNDFARLDARFVIPLHVWLKLPAYANWGFAVFKLRHPEEQNRNRARRAVENHPHPMAFEFETRMPDALFFPTVHIHDGAVHPYEEFDHELYMQGKGLRATHVSDIPDFLPVRLLREDISHLSPPPKPPKPPSQSPNGVGVRPSEAVPEIKGPGEPMLGNIFGGIRQETGPTATSVGNFDGDRMFSDLNAVGLMSLSQLRQLNRRGRKVFLFWEQYAGEIMKDGFPVTADGTSPEELLRKSRYTASHFHDLRTTSNIIAAHEPCFRRPLRGRFSNSDVFVGLTGKEPVIHRAATALGPRPRRPEQFRGKSIRIGLSVTFHIAASGRFSVTVEQGTGEPLLDAYVKRFLEQEWRCEPEMHYGLKSASSKTEHVLLLMD